MKKISLYVYMLQMKVIQTQHQYILMLIYLIMAIGILNGIVAIIFYRAYIKKKIMKANSAKQFLSLLAILHIIVGLTLPFLVNTRLFNYYNEQMLGAFNTSSIESLELGKFMLGILGPSIASWGVLFFIPCPACIQYRFHQRMDNHDRRHRWMVYI